MGLNRELVGKTYEGDYEVTPEVLEAYARATNDPNPRYLPGPDQIASPVWPVVPAFPLFMAAAKDPDLGADFLRLVHGAEGHVLHAPIRPGDHVHVAAALEDVGADEGGETFTVAATESNQQGAVVAEVRGIMVIREGLRRRPRRPPKPPEREAREVVYQEETVVDEDQPRRYAVAAGDDNPIHLDPEIAKQARLPGVILHGMCTMALACKAAVNGLAGGDPSRIRALSVRFNKPVFPGQELTTKLWLESESAKERVYGFETYQAAGAAVLKGSSVTVSGP